MKVKFNENLLIGIYIDADNWCKMIKEWMSRGIAPSAHKQRRRDPELTISEILTILIFYRHSDMKCFKYYYRRMAGFQEDCTKGKRSAGWLFELKIHLTINYLGNIFNFEIPPGNVQDNNPKRLAKLLKNLQGKLYEGKGYISQLFE